MEFEIVLIEEPEDGGYAVEVPELPGCFTHGATREEAIANAKDAIATHLAALRQVGEEAPHTERERVAVRV